MEKPALINQSEALEFAARGVKSCLEKVCFTVAPRRVECTEERNELGKEVKRQYIADEF